MYKQDYAFYLTVAEDADGASDWFWTGDATLLNLQIEYSASDALAGAFTLEASNARIGTAQAEIGPVDTVEDSSITVSDDAGTLQWNVAEVGFNWVRLKFTFNTASPEQEVTGRLVLKGPQPT